MLTKIIDISIVLIVMGLFTLSFGCSTARTKYSDPVLRVAINPEGIDENSYSRLQHALMQSGKYFVVDRGRAFLASVQEQNKSRIDAPHRFADAEKYARLKQLYGVGGIIQAHLHCHNSISFWSGEYTTCTQELAIVSTSTAEVLSTGETEQNVPLSRREMDRVSPAWDNVVEELNSNFPKNFEELKYTKEMKEFRQVAKDEALAGN